ncbi:hydrolase, nudix family protein [Heliomicrobium modesticaldum Ice1]|uniref:Hydrolase, nudix family protein n=1 Tax=Heliobacterium modesticaldum (strain ATCC 51547 / Ice1) TaxID=498761 RepID=B0TEK9_HELMI|nr:NUDIX hydrolase [Heliomicrobium modesticaldum]ABZ82928.1 hydrolase, nudix family protein [Heliomicrobium modesticaldum Ice1]
MEHLKEKTLESERVFDGNFIRLRKDRVVLPNGATSTREVVEHPGAAAIVPLTPRKEVVLIRQWRHPIKEVSIEIPAGKLSEDEDPLECAKRELSEETGFSARRWDPLIQFYASPGFCDEEMHLFIARDLYVSDGRPDEDEFVEPLVVPLEAALEMIETGEIMDAKSIIGLLRAARFLEMEKV